VIVASDNYDIIGKLFYITEHLEIC
jgi:hypothetical protein